MMPLPDNALRRRAIRKLIKSRWVGTQEELRRLLQREGFEVTQATLSRDLAQLGAHRVPLGTGGQVYELTPSLPPRRDEAEELSELVLDVVDNGSMVVIQTLSGAAPAVALAVDKARLSEVLGTLAGDDTIFVAPAKGIPAPRVTKRLKAFWRKGSR